ncbi:type II CRISPR RNA-guided endonuclease Cas9 [Azospira inquinata]|uniref:CRISPR-associated endonuclease Cas9 n=1 Tax=Azospira inquinata TaxID=2785627 RepID=A0A975XV03_9RHOO|nr:type II CRISPR RNA-guided endonuclease Cas9 [Azospira inquinata]QWT45331.1 type II CRISPR RNA-guided endonuclease Cas9 [Azospira inquinata]QWT49338.1 type II CRISPR RNA-guided endonuclease Cas9 [Azospira inquinata]
MSTTYTIGLDIGIASVGWCVLGENHIINLGVRAFDKAETAKEGESLNLVRRNARLMRRRLFRRAWRLKKLSRLLKNERLITDTKIFQPKHPFTRPLWQLRVFGIDHRLNDEEWARVIYHLCKHRGFHWISRAEAKQAEGDSKSEGGKVKKGLAGTAELMAGKGYRSAAEMVVNEFVKPQLDSDGLIRTDKQGNPIPTSAARNKQGEYTKALSRELLAKELTLLFEKQREFGNPHASSRLETTILGNGDKKSGLFWQQKPALAGADLLTMLGACTFEKDEYRAPKASFTAERHVWLTRLNNLRIVTGGVTRQLTEQERQLCLLLPYQQAGDLTYKQLGKALTQAGLLEAGSFKFIGLAYPTEGQKANSKTEDPESATLIKVPAWQELRKTLTKAGLNEEWKKLSGDALCGQPEIFDQIAWVLSVYKDDDEVRAELAKLSLPNRDALIDALLNIRFDKFHALSLKALRAIVPHMEKGLRYDEACIEAGYHHSQLHKIGEGEHKYLPSLYAGRDEDGRMRFTEDADIPRNPVVLRSLNQARKVVNAIVRRYGSPAAVHIEMARDLSRPLDERNKIKKEQDEYQARNQRDRERFIELFGYPPKGLEFEKWRLYREQNGQCIYTQKPLAPSGNVAEIFLDGSTEIDHALPYSRSFDDSKNNKVLVLTRENRDKGNRTPYEYLGGAENSERWQRFVAFVEANKAYRLAKRTRLLRKDFGEKEAEEFKERNLNDTRYICRFFKNYVERYLKLADGSQAKHCVVLSGQLTNFLRARWGLLKVRSDSDRHHALDAAVVAACSHSMVQRLSNYSRTRELEQVRNGFVDIETGEIANPAMHKQLREHFPDPWPYFRNELEARLKIDSPELLREEMARLGSYSEEELAALKPLFVSRAPQRRNGGAAHKDTIYGQPERFKGKGSVTQKVALASLTLKDLESLADPHRNTKLYGAIRERLEAHGGKGDKAFPASNPLRKPDKDGNPTGPIVRSVTKVIDKLSGIPVRGGIAKNDTMLRVDVFTKAGKFHLVPVYVHHRVTGLPNRAIVAFKDEEEWTLVDESFEWCFSLYPNDLVQIRLKKESFLGYYTGTDRSTGAISLWAHDRNQAVGKEGLMRGIGVKTAVSIEKFHVDTLGNIYPAPPEKRRGLA